MKELIIFLNICENKKNLHMHYTPDGLINLQILQKVEYHSNLNKTNCLNMCRNTNPNKLIAITARASRPNWVQQYI
jgi:hypothetical protein